MSRALQDIRYDRPMRYFNSLLHVSVGQRNGTVIWITLAFPERQVNVEPQMEVAATLTGCSTGEGEEC